MKYYSIKSFITIGSIAVSILLSQCKGAESSENEGVAIETGSESGPFIKVSQKQFQTMKMSWGNPAQQEFSEGLAVQGMVKVPVEGIQEISAYFGGYVSGLKLLEGEPVKKGQVLFYLESPEFIRLQQEYMEINSQLNYLKAEYERQKTLYSENISSQKVYLKAEAEYQGAKSKAESIKRQLAMINIDAEKLTPETIRSKVPVMSPIAGFVEEIHLVQGAYLEATGKAMTIISKEHLHIELVLFEKDAAKVKPGQKVLVTVPDLPGKEFEAEVYVVGQTINDQRQINVHAHLPNDSEEISLLPGMFLEAKLQLDPKEALLVPVTAVVNSEGQDYVLLQKEKSETGYTLEKVEVKLGRQSDEKIELLPNDSLNENSVILTHGAFNLLP